MSALGINAVSLATTYKTFAAWKGQVYEVRGGNLFSAGSTTPVLQNGIPVTADQYGPTISDESWRGPGGVDIQTGWGAQGLLARLADASPNVNTLRVDFNAETLMDSVRLAKWATFVGKAVDAGYGIIIQYSSGALAGGPAVDAAGAIVDTRTTDPIAAAAGVAQGWAQIMAWLEKPENARILAGVTGFELINEPMAFRAGAVGMATGAEAATAYEHAIETILGAANWHGKDVLVGGLGASSHFGVLNLDAIKADVAASTAGGLIWSAHLHPQWISRATADPDFEATKAEILSRIGTVIHDRLLISEIHLDRYGSSALDPTTGDQTIWTHARMMDWLAEQGVGITYWPPFGRGAAYLTKEGVRLPIAAWMENLWTADDPGTGIQTGPNQLTATVGKYTGVGYAAGYGGNDALDGTGLSDMLFGGSGNDKLSGGDGDDMLFGQSGSDSLVGGNGDDFLYGGSGRDTLDGGSGADTLDGGGGADLLSASAGNDLLVLYGGERASGGAGADRFVVAGTAGTITITDFTQGEVIDLRAFGPGGHAKRVISELVVTDERDARGALTGAALIHAQEPGRPVIRLEGVSADAVRTDWFTGLTKSWTLDRNAERIATAGPGCTPAGSGANDTVTGTYGDDHLVGLEGNDILRGDWGNDTLEGGDGNDRLNGGFGDDLLDGGEGRDTAVFFGTGAVTVNLGLTTPQNTGRGVDRLIGVERIESGSGNDRLAGNMASNAIKGFDGNDTIDGAGGNDVLWGGRGADVFVFRPGQGNDKVADFVLGTDRLHLAAIDPADVTLKETATGVTLSWTGGSVALIGEALHGHSVTDFL